MSTYLRETTPHPSLWRRTPKTVIAWFDSSGAKGGPLPPPPLPDFDVAPSEAAAVDVVPGEVPVDARVPDLPVAIPEGAPVVTLSDEKWDDLWPALFGEDLWNAILELEDAAVIRSPFTDAPGELDRLVRRGEALDAGYRELTPPNFERLARYIEFLLRPGWEPFAFLARVRRIGGQFAYIASGSEVPLPSLKDYVFDTADLPTPLPQYTADGLDITKSTTGQPPLGSVDFADVEYNWNAAHQAFAYALREDKGNLAARPAERRSHGTAMVGIVAGGSQTFRGVEPAARIVFSSVNAKPDPTLPRYTRYADAITAATTELTKVGAPRGGVMLLELQSQRDGVGPLRPVEFEFACWDAIRLATANGITVIEPSGNGGVNVGGTFGGAQNPTEKGWPNDSEAIMVGAAAPHAPHARWKLSGYGPRVDCFGWHEGVVSSAVDDLETVVAKKRDNNAYFLDCGGTSAASAMIAGAALAIQSLADQLLGGQLPPPLIRAILATHPRRAVYCAGDGKVGAMIRLGAVRAAARPEFEGIVRTAWQAAFGISPPAGGQLVEKAWAEYGGPT